MKKNYFSAALLVVASTFTAQAIAVTTGAVTTTIDFQDMPSGTTLINNLWFIQAGSLLHLDPPYSKATSDVLGTISVAPIVGLNDSAHIHVNGGDGNPATPTVPFIHGDVGGVFISGTGSHSAFSFSSMDVLDAVLQSDNLIHPNATVTVRGFKGGVNGMLDGIVEADGTTMQYSGGSKVAETTIANGFTGTVDFLAQDAGFGDVDYVEFFFTDFYRQLPSSLGDGAFDFKFDNIVVDTAAVVPVPAAVWLFGSGMLGLLSFGKRKQNS